MDRGGKLIGVLAVHVDDTIGGGRKVFYDIMDAVAISLKIGSKEESNFHCKGLRISTRFGKDGSTFEIVVDGDEYLDSTVAMSLKSYDGQSFISPVDFTNARSVAGCLGYMASSFRPDLSFEASLLGRSFARPTLFDTRKANVILAWAKDNRFPLVFRRVLRTLTVFTDAAGPNELGTQGCSVYALTDVEGHKVTGWIFWESRKVNEFAALRPLQKYCH
jgi:hypothetical protein